jgi:hypothetical protein
MDKSIFKNVLKYYADAQSLEEFTIRLDLIDWALNDFNFMYLELIVPKFPIFFKRLQKLKNDEKFNIITFTNEKCWRKKAPIDIILLDDEVNITYRDGEHITIQKLYLLDVINRGGPDSIEEYCNVLIYEMYGE